MISLNQRIDHTNLKPYAQEKDIEALCAEARQYGFASVCVYPCYIELAKRLLAGSETKVCSVIGFPMGANATPVKAAETADALARGCEEFDMVINVGALKDGRDAYVRDDIRAVKEAAQGRIVKVILETGLLTDEEKTRAVRLAAEAGADFVKTCTGFNGGRATVEDVALMRAAAPAWMKVKAAGSIRTRAEALAMLEAGAERIGTSAGVKLVQDAPEA